MPLQIRRGLEVERNAMSQPLASGELLYVTDSQRLYIGNGTTLGGVQITGYTNEDAQDAAAALLTNGTHSGITFTYGVLQDGNNRIDATVDLSTYTGSISGDLVGSVFADNSIMLVDGTNGQIVLDGTVKGHIVPNTSEAFDLGSASNRFRDLYLSGSSIRLGNAIITSTGSAVNLPAGSTVNGVPIGSGGGDGVTSGSSYNINIVADDSTIIVNSSTETVTAQGGFVGDLTGNVSGNVSGNVTGNVNGVVTATAGSSLVGNVTGNVNGNVTGDLLGNSSGFHTGDVKGSIFGLDSSVLVDSIDNVITGRVQNLFTETGILTINQNLAGGGLAIFSEASLDDDVDIFNIVTAHNDAVSSGISFVRSRGTIASPTALNTNDEIFTMLFAGQSSTDLQPAARIDVVLDGSVGTSIVPGKIKFSTSDSTGTSVERLTINSKGTSEFKGMLQLPTYADESAANTAVGTPVNGMMYYDTGASKIKGYQGGAWVVLQP